MSETHEDGSNPVPGHESLKKSDEAVNEKITWDVVHQMPLDQQREVYRRLFEASCSRRRQLRAEGYHGRDPLPPPIDDSASAPPVEVDALKRLASNSEMLPEEVSRLFSLIDLHRVWHDAYHELLDEQIREEF